MDIDKINIDLIKLTDEEISVLKHIFIVIQRYDLASEIRGYEKHIKTIKKISDAV
jgi:hypothetical protein